MYENQLKEGYKVLYESGENLVDTKATKNLIPAELDSKVKCVKVGVSPEEVISKVDLKNPSKFTKVYEEAGKLYCVDVEGNKIQVQIVSIADNAVILG